MRRIATLASIILGLSMVLVVPVVINATPAAAETASECAAKGWTFTATSSCIAPVVPAETTPAPAMMPCWNGTSVPVTSACPVAPTTTYTPTTPSVTCPDGTSHPSGFVCPTTTTSSGAGSGGTITCPDGSVHGTPFTCPTTSGSTGSGVVGTFTSPATALCPDKITLVSQGCPTTSGSGSTGSSG
ncbi:MAG: hypothetical protein WCP54_07890, partial [Actinomycetes bacterium]